MNTPTESTGTFLPGAWLPVAVLVLSLLLLGVGGCSSDDEDVYASEGTLSSPIDITAAFPNTRESTVGAEPSYYKFTSTATRTYTVSISGMRYDADLAVYENSDFLTQVLCVSITIGTANETCGGIATVTTLYVMVPSHSEFGTAFTLSVIETP